MTRLSLLVVAMVCCSCGPGRDCAPSAEKLGPCSEQWSCPGGTLRWSCDGGSCECVENGTVHRNYASAACPFSSGDGFEQAGEANSACGWSIPYNP